MYEYAALELLLIGYQPMPPSVLWCQPQTLPEYPVTHSVPKLPGHTLIELVAEPPDTKAIETV
jgi:hypothetical protein